MSIEDIRRNLNEQVMLNTSTAVHYLIYYYMDRGTMRTHYYLLDGSHECGLEDCPANG